MSEPCPGGGATASAEAAVTPGPAWGGAVSGHRARPTAQATARLLTDTSAWETRAVSTSHSAARRRGQSPARGTQACPRPRAHVPGPGPSHAQGPEPGEARAPPPVFPDGKTEPRDMVNASAGPGPHAVNTGDSDAFWQSQWPSPRKWAWSPRSGLRGHLPGRRGQGAFRAERCTSQRLGPVTVACPLPFRSPHFSACVPLSLGTTCQGHFLPNASSPPSPAQLPQDQGKPALIL